MRVALIRGPQPNPLEMRAYAPLLRQGFEPTAFTSEAPLFERPERMPTARLPTPADAAAPGRAGGA